MTDWFWGTVVFVSKLAGGEDFLIGFIRYREIKSESHHFVRFFHKSSHLLSGRHELDRAPVRFGELAIESALA